MHIYQLIAVPAVVNHGLKKQATERKKHSCEEITARVPYQRERKRMRDSHLNSAVH